METQIPVFNPRHLSHDLLEKMLVGRETLLQELEEDLIRQATSRSRQHWLIRGPRGFGKTHLAGLLYYRTLAHPVLFQKYLPIWLNETAAYQVYSAGTLLRVIADQLVKELKENNPAEAAALSETLHGITVLGDDPALFEDLDELLRGIASRTHKILLILMENLDALLDSFAKSRSNMEAKKLRSLLSHEKAYLFISTTPTHYLPKISHPKAPLYGQLKERLLPALSEEDTEKLLRQLIGLTGRANTLSLIMTGQEWNIRRRVLYRLTGGIPRAVVMSASMISGIPGLTALVKEFRMTLDGLTPYFEGRLSALAPRERVIVTAMALASENLTIKAIAQKTGLPERSLSTLVKRLEIEGILIPSEGEGGKGTIYELREGLFRIWYQFRQANRILPPLIRFLALWSSPEELESNLNALKSDQTLFSSDFEKDLIETTVLQLGEALKYVQSEKGRIEREKLWAECWEELSNLRLGEIYFSLTQKRLPSTVERMDFNKLIEAVGELDCLLLRDSRQIWPELSQILFLRNILSRKIAETGHHLEAEKLFRKVINRFRETTITEIQEELARAMLFLGFTLGEQGLNEEVISICWEIIKRFNDADKHEIQVSVASAMLYLGVTLESQGQIKEAVSLYRETIKKYKDIDRLDMQGVVAFSMTSLGDARNSCSNWKKGFLFTER